jgi:predicted ATP-grasp superfamily ATP-dependent carboligase
VPSRLAKPGTDAYYQKRVAGRAVSALFVANGERARVLGFSEQWIAPSPRGAFRYGGAVMPAALPRKARQAMTEAVERVVAAFCLKGLGSADFMLGEAGPLLLEINPRPGATLDIFDGDAAPLLRLHLDAVLEGKLPGAPLPLECAKASAIVYAPQRVTVPPCMVWPDWAADIPKASELIDKNRPICTVLARAPAKTRAKRLAEARTKKILKTLDILTKGKTVGQAIDEKGGTERRAARGLAEHQRQGGAARARADR